MTNITTSANNFLVEGSSLVIERPRGPDDDDTDVTVFENAVSDDMRPHGRHSIVASVALEIEREIKDKLVTPLTHISQSEVTEQKRGSDPVRYSINHKPGTREWLHSKLFHSKDQPTRPPQSYRSPSAKESFNEESIDKQTGQSSAPPENNPESAGIRFIDEEDPHINEPHIHPADRED